MNSLKSKLFFAGFLVAILPMIVYQLVTYYQSSTTLQATYSKELEQKTELTSLLINKSIFQSLSDFKILSSNTAEWINLDKMKQVSKQFEKFNDIHFDVDSISLFNKNGKHLLSNYKNQENQELITIKDKMLNAYLASEMDDVYIYEEINQNQSKVFVLNKVPTIDTHFLLIELNFNNIELLLSNIEDEILGNKPILILNKKSEIIYSTHEMADKWSGVKVSTEYLEYTDQHRDFMGEMVLSSYDEIFEFGINDAFGWHVLTSIPIKLINEKVYTSLKLNINIGIAITILVFLLLLYEIKSISYAIKNLLGFAKELGDGRYGAIIKARSTVKEFNDLSDILNEMSSTIKKRDNELVEKNKLFHDLAHYDSLTSIPNRILFQDRLEHAIIKAKRSHSSLALLFIDLDQFKHINDSFGHDFGDQILKVTAQRLKSILREEDTVARLGGDEFTIILEDITEQMDIINISTKLIEVIKRPIRIENHDFHISCSVGISMYPEDAKDRTNLVKYADTAMYKAKALGRGVYQFYSSELTQISIERVQLEKEIHHALNREEFEVYYQPQVNSLTNKMTGFEALVRWNHPEKGFIPPSEFLPFAEEMGLIALIDEWVMNKAMSQLARWYDAGYKPGKLALNLSMKMLENSHFTEMIQGTLADTRCSAGWIELELTEGQIMKNYDYSIEKLQQISDLGIEIAIDDFGTGYSSLAYLKHLPLNKLKIDKSFVDDLPADIEDIEIVKTIILLAKGLHLDIIAEGVETKQQKRFLNENGCVNVQGYLYSKPLKAADLEEILKRGSSFEI